MTTPFNWIIFALSTTLSLSSPAIDLCQHDEHTFCCVEYLGNYDGDTVRFDIPNIHPLLGKNISVRIRGIDTAELKTKDKCEKQKALEAKELVEGLLKNAKRIDLENVQRDKYFRILATVVADGVSAADHLVQRRLANKYDGGTKQKTDWCQMGSAGRVPSSSSITRTTGDRK